MWNHVLLGDGLDFKQALVLALPYVYILNIAAAVQRL